jgi:uncharacterized membrane protein
MERPAGSDGAARQEAGGPGLTAGRDHALVVALRVGLVVVGLSPFVAPYARRVMSASAGDFLYALFAPVCHRDPARTLLFAGVLMPICSRCAGIFAGFVTAGVRPRPRWSVRACLAYGFVASVVMVIDVVLQDMGVHPVWHPIRLATGVAWGHVCGLGLVALVRERRLVTSSA